MSDFADLIRTELKTSGIYSEIQAKLRAYVYCIAERNKTFKPENEHQLNETEAICARLVLDWISSHDLTNTANVIESELGEATDIPSISVVEKKFQTEPGRPMLEQLVDRLAGGTETPTAAAPVPKSDATPIRSMAIPSLPMTRAPLRHEHPTQSSPSLSQSPDTMRVSPVPPVEGRGSPITRSPRPAPISIDTRAQETDSRTVTTGQPRGLPIPTESPTPLQSQNLPPLVDSPVSPAPTPKKSLPPLTGLGGASLTAGLLSSLDQSGDGIRLSAVGLDVLENVNKTKLPVSQLPVFKDTDPDLDEGLDQFSDLEDIEFDEDFEEWGSDEEV